MHREIEVSRDYTFEWEFIEQDLIQIVTSGTVDIVDNGGTSVVSSASVTLTTGGRIEYTFLTADNDTEAKNFKLTLTYVVDAVSRKVYELFDVVKTPLRNLVSDEDLFNHLSELRTKIRERVVKTTSTGTTTTTTSTDLISDKTDYKGGQITIYDTSDVPHNAQITDYDQPTGVITFLPAYSTAVASTLTIRVRSSYQRYIDEAYNNFVYRDTRNSVKIAAGYIDSNVTRNMTIYKTLEIYCLAAIEIEGDKWDLRYKAFSQMYKDELAFLNEPYDTNEDGNISDSENDERPSIGIVDIVR